MTREELIELLKTDIFKVVFTKVNGERREMFCTLRNELLPEGERSERKPSSGTVPVWDLDKDAWRSFRIESLISVEKYDLSDG
jgi:hypothetical protein